MMIRPNEGKEPTNSVLYLKNNLFKKFKNPFLKMLNPDAQFYDVNSYVHIDEILEEAIKDDLEAEVDCLDAVLGSTGIGKTHFMRSVLASFHNCNSFDVNNPIYLKNPNGKTDIVYYCAHEKYNTAALENPERLLNARVKALNDSIMREFSENHDFGDVKGVTLERYIQDNKNEIAFYDDENNAKTYARTSMTYKILIDRIHESIGNVIFVYDDLESFTQDEQLKLIRSFLNLYECFKNKKPDDVYYKFFFCMRKYTHAALLSNPIYNTHRKYNVFIIRNHPKLSDLFEKRFRHFVDGEINKVNNIDDWIDAKDKLFLLADELERVSGGFLFDFCNNNISDALICFTHILANKTWTQKNKNMLSAFKINEYDYSINQANMLRVLFKREELVYFNTNENNSQSLFVSGGDKRKDFLCMYILAYISKKSKNQASAGCTKEELIITFKEFCLSIYQNEEALADNISEILEYYTNYSLIGNNENENRLYYLTPKGNATFRQFLYNSILFGIFRDQFVFDDKYYSIKCSHELSSLELDQEYYKYINGFKDYEYTVLDSIFKYPQQKDLFKIEFGNELISTSLYKGLYRSLDRYTEDDLNEVIKLKNEIEYNIRISEEKFNV